MLATRITIGFLVVVVARMYLLVPPEMAGGEWQVPPQHMYARSPPPLGQGPFMSSTLPFRDVDFRFYFRQETRRL